MGVNRSFIVVNLTKYAGVLAPNLRMLARAMNLHIDTVRRWIERRGEIPLYYHQTQDNEYYMIIENPVIIPTYNRIRRRRQLEELMEMSGETETVKGQRQKIVAYLNEQMIVPDDAGHLEGLMEILDIEFISEEEGWVMIDYIN